MTPDECQAVERLRELLATPGTGWRNYRGSVRDDLATLLRLVEQRPAVDRDKLTQAIDEYLESDDFFWRNEDELADAVIAAMDWRDAGELKKAEADIATLLGVASRSKKRADRLRGVVAAVEALCEAPRWSGHEIPWGWVTVDELRQAIAAAQPQGIAASVDQATKGTANSTTQGYAAQPQTDRELVSDAYRESMDWPIEGKS